MIRRNLMGLAGAVLMSTVAAAADPESCKTVRFSDVGWTDITATTAVDLARAGGPRLQADGQVLSVPVTYASMKNKDIDVFLGNWMPTHGGRHRKPYRRRQVGRDGRANLEGAKYTLAVPTYLYDKGLKDFTDIAKFKDQLDGKIYGIEPGNDGNRLIIGMIDKRQVRPRAASSWSRSREQGMLAAGRARREATTSRSSSSAGSRTR